MCRIEHILLRKVFTISFINILIFCGCVQSKESEYDIGLQTKTIRSHAEEENKLKYVETSNTGENNEPANILAKPLEIPTNTNAVDISFYGDEYIELLSSSLCKTDGRNIYFHTELGFYAMPVGTDELNPVDIEFPEEMDIFNFTFDSYGKMHLLIANRIQEEYFIWRLDEKYKVDKVIDISVYAETIHNPAWGVRWFLVFEDDSYYVQWGWEQDGIIVSSEGVLEHKFTRESLEIGWVRQVAVGTDGHIYVAHAHGDEKVEIGKLNIETGLVINENPDLYFPSVELFYTMSGGTDTNLLLFSVYSGIWAYDTDDEIMENRMSSLDVRMGMDKDSDFWSKLFLPDGRLFLIGLPSNEDTNGNAISNIEKSLLLRYIPAGN